MEKIQDMREALKIVTTCSSCSGNLDQDEGNPPMLTNCCQISLCKLCFDSLHKLEKIGKCGNCGGKIQPSKCLPNRPLSKALGIFNELQGYNLVRKPDTLTKFEVWVINHIRRFTFYFP